MQECKNTADTSIKYATLEEQRKTNGIARWALGISIFAVIYMTHSVLPGMIKRNRGHIINIGSIAGHGVYPKGTVYCATKHAVRTLSQGLRMDLCGTKVRVSTVEPGMVRTEFSLVRFKHDNERAQKTYEGFHPLEASDVADAVAYCAYSPDHVNIDDIVIMPLDQAALSMVNRTS